jgi:hypothetical protein
VNVINKDLNGYRSIGTWGHWKRPGMHIELLLYLCVCVCVCALACVCMYVCMCIYTYKTMLLAQDCFQRLAFVLAVLNFE